AENLAKRYDISREAVDRFAARSFERAIAAEENGILAEETVPVVSETFESAGFELRGIRLPKGTDSVVRDTHIRPSPYEVLAKLRPLSAASRPAATHPPSSTAPRRH